MMDSGLKKYFGFSEFKTGQKEVISRIVGNQFAAAIFPTDAGKSLCYQLPAMFLPGLTLVDFFESSSCISKELAHYFGEDINKEGCGHCSFCEKGAVSLQNTMDLPPLRAFNYGDLAGPFIQIAGGDGSVANMTKFLCGISSPALIKLKANES